MRIVALDVGDKRIGVAASDILKITAQAAETYERKGKGDFRYIADLLKRLEADTVVVGLPLNMNGTTGLQAEKVKDFVAELKKHIDIDVVFQDERLTTSAANRVLLEADMSRKKRKKVVDQIAAVYILQSYLK